VPAECENCAYPDDALVAVHRVYVIPESWDTPASITVLEDTEYWCIACVSQYPSQPAE
jgi:hypothetical protein